MKMEIQQNLFDREKDVCTKTLQRKNLEAKLRLEEKDGKTLQCTRCGEQVSFLCREQILAVISDGRELICGECAGLPECYECNNLIGEEEDYTTIEIFNSPFDEEGKEVHLHENCLSLLFDTGWADFRYFECGICGRTICQQNPMNGYHIQYRATEYIDYICLQCYESHILEYGLPREEFEQGLIPGMFFSAGNTEAIDAGYSPVKEFENYFVQGKDRKNKLLNKACELIDEGQKVVIAYESLSIIGDEGYISMFAKK